MKIKKLNIHRLPGIPQGLGDQINELADNINVIAGPNGSGKSSTAQLIQKLIWWNPQEGQGLTADATLQVDGKQQQIKIDFPTYLRTDEHQQPSEQDFSKIAPPTYKGYYMLALHDLVKDDNDDLAEIIVKEINGGIDLLQAAKTLTASDKAMKKADKTRRLQEAKQDIKNKQQQQDRIKEEEERLQELEEEKDKASKAAGMKTLYEKLILFLQAKDDYQTANQIFDQFNPSLANLREEDYTTICQAESTLKEITENLAEHNEELLNKHKKLGMLTIPETGIDKEILNKLTRRKDKLIQLEQEIAVINRDSKRLESQKEQAAKAINADIDLTTWNGLTLEDMHKLDKLTRLVNRYIGEKNQLEEERKNLEEAVGDNRDINSSTQQEKFKDGIKELSNWLKGKAIINKKPMWLYLLLIIVASLAAVASQWITNTNTPGLSPILLIVAVGLFIFTFSLKNTEKRKEEAELEISKKRFIKLGIPLPESWESSSVAIRLDELLKEATHLATISRQQQRLNKIDNQLKEISQELQSIHNAYHKLKWSFGNLPEIIKSYPDSHNTLYYFLKQVFDWQKASVELETGVKVIKSKQEEYIKCIAECNETLSQFSFANTATREEVENRLNELQEQEALRKDLTNEIANLQKLIKVETENKNRQEKSIENICQRLSITGNDYQLQIKNLLNQQESYSKAKNKKNNTYNTQVLQGKQLENHPLYEETLTQYSIETVSEKIKEYTVLSESIEQKIREIERIKNDIESKKKSNDIELALNEKQQAEADLQECFEHELKTMTDTLLIDYLRKEKEINNENKIFISANHTLSNITKGRYSLLLSNDKKATFKARDTKLNRIQELKELSTGTRVQFLLSVRLAYIQNQEHKIKFPILADELLANSDDSRTEKIIESLIEISKERQLFYFTAQKEEVDKWFFYLNKNKNLSSKISILGQETSYSPTEIQPNTLQLVHQPIAPRGLSHPEYGKQLHIPPFNVIEQETSEMHLWYLITDTALLYECLRLGIRHWGELENFIAKKGIIDGMNVEIWKQLNDKVELINRYLMLRRIGYPKRIRPEVLESCFGNHTKKTEMIAILEEERGDPIRLLSRLRAGHIKRFQTKNIENLEEYLLEEGYIDNKTCLTDEEIATELKVNVTNMNIQPDVANNYINQFINSLKETTAKVNP